jgi:hypothetical protein
MSNREGFFYCRETAAMTAAVRAQQLLERAGPYRTKVKRQALINAVRSAVDPFCNIARPSDLSVPIGDDENPLLRLAPGPSLGFANGFLTAWAIRDPAALAVIKKHGLYFAGMAALSLAHPSDSVEAITTLSNMIETWEAGRRGLKQSTAASAPRSVFVELARSVVLENSGASAKDIWQKLIGLVQMVIFKGKSYSVDVVEEDGVLYWEAYANDADEDEETKTTEGSCKWSTFPSFISKLK